MLNTEAANAKATFASNLASALNADGEHEFIADGNKISLNGEKIIEVKSLSPEPEDVEGVHLQNQPGGLKIGFIGNRGDVIAPQGYPAASLGETLLGKVSSALAPREVINPETGEAEITLASAAKRADAMGSKDVADSIAIAQRYLEAHPNLAAQSALDNFKQLALDHTTVDANGNVVPLVTEAKIAESLNEVDTDGITATLDSRAAQQAPRGLSAYTSPYVGQTSALPISSYGFSPGYSSTYGGSPRSAYSSVSPTSSASSIMPSTSYGSISSTAPSAISSVPSGYSSTPTTISSASYASPSPTEQRILSAVIFLQSRVQPHQSVLFEHLLTVWGLHRTAYNKGEADTAEPGNDAAPKAYRIECNANKRNGYSV